MSLLATSESATAQTNVNEEKGMKPYDSWHGGDLDSISMTNGGLVLHIQLLSFPQRGNLDLSFSVYFNTKQWATRINSLQCGNPNDPNGCTPHWVPLVRGAQPLVGGGGAVEGAYVTSSLDWLPDNECHASSALDGTPVEYTGSTNLFAPDGSSHPFGTVSDSYYGCTSIPARALDASGILWSDLNTIMMPNGTRFQFGSYPNPTTITDANGNRISIDSNIGNYTDTLGRVITPPAAAPAADVTGCPSGASSAQAWTVPGLAGGTRTFKLCFSSVSIFTNFGQGATEYGPANNTLLTAIILPDSTAWTFSYDHYGDLTRLGFPTGGSISYTYAMGPLIACGNNTPVSMFVTSRTVDANDGTGGHTWTYTYTAPTSTASGTMVVTSPESNDTVHTIGDPITGKFGCSLYDLQVQNYKGSHSGGTLLRTAATQYSADSILALMPSTVNVVPKQTSVSWPNGHSSKVVNTWDSGNSESQYGTTIPLLLGSLLQKDEYDFSNTLVRSTVNHYLWQDSATYKNNNFLQLMVSSTVKDGAGNQVAQTTYGHDEYGAGQPVPSGITTGFVSPPAGGNIRGNATTVSHWLNTPTNSFISSTGTYFDTGMKASSTDPKGNVTTYTYDSTFVGAYMTQTNMSDTQMPDSGAPIVHHVISGNYDFNTGLLKSFTDENGQIYTYTYDSAMLRLTEGDHPDGGKTLFNYPSATQVERQRLISGTTYDDYKVNFDGLGRPIQTQHPTPSGTILTDTTYDVVGRTSTVSNPYYQGSDHNSDPTYGITTTQYDALSRATKTIKQDGSFSKVAYDDNCVTATDEAGKLRKVCSDALGRMVEVDEPGVVPPQSNYGSMQTDGNFVVYNQAGTALWSTGTAGTGASTFEVQDDGNVVLYIFKWSAGVYAAATPGTYNNTCGTATALNAGQTLASGQCLVSPSGQYILYMAPDGNLYIYDNAHNTGTWGPGTGGHPGAYATLQLDGNFVVYAADGTALWSSGTGGTYSERLELENDGRIIIFRSAWNSGTSHGWGTGSMAHPGCDWGPGTGTTGTMPTGVCFVSPNGLFELLMQTDGNLVLYDRSVTPMQAMWNAGTAFSPVDPSIALKTLYTYDTLGNLLCVEQHGGVSGTGCSAAPTSDATSPWRVRRFSYDSLSRLLSTKNPESGTINYAYDNNGNMISKTSPAPNQTVSATVITTYTYDSLNRLLDKSYNDGATPTASFRYDYSTFMGQSFTSPIGRGVAATAASGTISSFVSYDPMGRVVSTTQCNPGGSGCKSSSSAYDKLGDATSTAYPVNNFTVTYGYDAAARLTSASDSNGVTYAQTPTFLASGAIQEFSSPNFNNNKFHADYNSRLQPTEIWAGPSAGANALFDKKYSYSNPNTPQMNNGNVYTVTNVKDDSRTQSFTYDSLNRLLGAGDKTHWSNTYVYDAWGNLYQKNPGPPAGENLVKVADTNNRLSGLSYDAAGNVTNDGTGNTFVYDAENRIISSTNNGVTTTYTYDAGGQRIQKASGSTVTNYWLGLAETDSSGNITNYIFFAGQRLARNIPQPSPNPPDIKYYITDHLHSTAMFVDKNGTVLDDNDFYPWGGVVPGVGTTTSNNHYKFTGKERDTESQLDYFGARYYANITGRFMSPDWAAKPTSVPYAEFGDPQSLNLYSYVRNSPVVRVDADGHDLWGIQGTSVAPGIGEGGGGSAPGEPDT